MIEDIKKTKRTLIPTYELGKDMVSFWIIFCKKIFVHHTAPLILVVMAMSNAPTNDIINNRNN